MAAKVDNSVDRLTIAQELGAARKRLESAEKALKDAEAALVFASREGLKSTEKVVLARVKRLRDAHLLARGVVAELEKVAPGLPL